MSRPHHIARDAWPKCSNWALIAVVLTSILTLAATPDDIL